jgi:hypothetical protein
MRTVVRELSALAVAGILTAALASPAAAAEPIGPGQHFVGQVNGLGASATAVPVVRTVCAGPVWPGRTGPVAGGQTLAVHHVAAGGGYTGLFSQVYAWVEQDASMGGPQQVRFTTYDTKLDIPAAVRVPCDGPGEVTFSSCPRLAPCAAGWIPTSIKVRFRNIAF